MNRNYLQSLIQGTPAPIPTAFDAACRLDLAKMADMTQWWVEQGLGTKTAAFKVASAMGQGPDLGDDEWPHLLSTVVNAAGSGATILCALKAKNTLHTIEDAKRAQDLGAVGLQIDLPFFHHPDQDANVRHFTAISDAIDIGIMIYNTWWFCQNPAKEYINADTMSRLEDAERVVAIKWSTPPGEEYDQMSLFSGKFSVIDNTGDKIRCHRNGGRGYISSLISAYAQYDLDLWQLLEAERYEEARKKEEDVARVFAQHGGAGTSALLAAMGRPMGTTRPPSLPPTDSQIAGARSALTDLGWVQ